MINPIHNFGKLDISTVPQSPESPGNNRTNFLNSLERAVFQEILSAESSLRLPPPPLPHASPKPYPFPVSMFGIYVAGEGLRCEEITRSIMDSLNEEMKWLPFTRSPRTMDEWNEQVEGDWESYVDYTAIAIDGDLFVLKCNETTKIEEELLETCNMDARLDKLQPANELLNMVDIVRKRKSATDQSEIVWGNESEREWKRSHWSQQYRLREFMKVRGKNLNDSDYNEIPAEVMISIALLSQI